MTLVTLVWLLAVFFQVNPSRGIVTVGCSPLVTNYNIVLGTDDRRLAAQVTRRVREKDGGLPWVRRSSLCVLKIVVHNYGRVCMFEPEQFSSARLPN